MKRSEKNITWIERHCRIPEGKDIGKQVKLREWQVKEIEKIYDNEEITRTAILSFGRKNGKTSLVSFLLLLHLCGPEARSNSQLYSCAQSREQAAVLFHLAAKIIRISPTLSQFVKIRETAKELLCPEIGTYYRSLSAEASTAYGLSPVFIVHDELGQVKGPRSELYDALETATGAHENPLSVVISTQAATNGDLLSILIDDALQGHDPSITVSLYTADTEIDPFSEEAIRQANPAYGDFLDPKSIKKIAAEASRMPAREAAYRNLHLNQRVEMSNPFVSGSVWRECGSEPIESFEGLQVYGGLDLSSTSDLTAAVFIASVDGIWHVKPRFWLPKEGLREKSQRDRIPYDKWADRGLLILTPGRTVEYEYVALELRKIFNEMSIAAIGFDRWNFKHFKPWLQRADFDNDEIERFKEFGQGFVSMSPALLTLESDLLGGKIRHGMHPVLTMCAANAVVQMDAAGNRKLAKDKSSGRIDGMVALTMARAVAASAEIARSEYVEGGVFFLS